MELHPLDTLDILKVVVETSLRAFGEEVVLKQKVERVGEWYNRLRTEAERLDGEYRALLKSEDDLVQYAGRMNSCVGQLQTLEEMAKISNWKKLDLVQTGAAVGYLESQFYGMRLTLDWIKNTRSD